MKKTLYHGSYEIVQGPKYGRGKEYNDYGQGFYLTEDPDLACEWAVNDGLDGFVSRYEIEMDDLSILCLNSEECRILHWLALLVDNRKFRIFTPVMARAKEWLTENYLIDLGFYDAVIGYRADDSYFTFAKDFLNNSITLGQLSRAMKLGELGEQYGVPKTAIAIAWILRHPARMQAIAGTMNPEHLRDICAAAKVNLTHNEWYQIYLASGKFLP